MKLKKIDSQKANVVPIAKVIQYAEMVSKMENNVTFVSHVNAPLLILQTHLHITARNL